MKTSEIKKLRKQMEKVLESRRYEHTLGVAYTAATLAMIHGEDADKALTAGMLHDCAKCIEYQKQLKICEKNHIALSDTEREKDSRLIHAKTGSVLAKERYGVTDDDILNAISYHTTGRPGMSLLEKIIYIADYIEPGRGAGHKSPLKYAESLKDVRKMAYGNLDEALCKLLCDTLVYLKEEGGTVDPMTQKTYEYYVEKQQKGDSYGK